MCRIATASSSLSVCSTLPTQCACGSVCDAPSNDTALSAMYLKWCPKSHQEFMIAFGWLLSLIFVSVFHHASFTRGTSPITLLYESFAMCTPVFAGLMMINPRSTIISIPVIIL